MFARPWFVDDTLFFFFLIFWDRVSLCSPSCLGTWYAYQPVLELTRSPCLCLLSVEIKGMCHHWPANFILFFNSKKTKQVGMVVHTCNPSIQEAEVRDSMPACPTQWIPDHPNSEILIAKQDKNLKTDSCKVNDYRKYLKCFLFSN